MNNEQLIEYKATLRKLIEAIQGEWAESRNGDYRKRLDGRIDGVKAALKMLDDIK